MILWRGLVLVAFLAQPAYAQDQGPQARPVVVAEGPTRPMARPVPSPQTAGASPVASAAAAGSAPVPDLRPQARRIIRPELARDAATRPEFRADRNVATISIYAVAQSPRPQVRPAAITARVVEQRVARARGQVCGDPAIQGEAIGNVAGSGACGISNAVRVRSVAGVRLQPAAEMDCPTAEALKGWVARSAKPAIGQTGGGLVSLRVVAGYACRNRNNASSGRLSEHAFGRAIDIAGFGLANGREITVLTDWNKGAAGDALMQIWRGACGPFGTVLGPRANAAHRDHFHLDTARYRSGTYCR